MPSTSVPSYLRTHNHRDWKPIRNSIAATRQDKTHQTTAEPNPQPQPQPPQLHPALSDILFQPFILHRQQPPQVSPLAGLVLPLTIPFSASLPFACQVRRPTLRRPGCAPVSFCSGHQRTEYVRTYSCVPLNTTSLPGPRQPGSLCSPIETILRRSEEAGDVEAAGIPSGLELICNFAGIGR